MFLIRPYLYVISNKDAFAPNQVSDSTPHLASSSSSTRIVQVLVVA